MGSQIIATYIPNLDTRCSGEFQVLPVYSLGKNDWYRSNLRIGKPEKGPGRIIRSPYLFYLLILGAEVYFHLITLRHTPQSVGLHWMRDRPVAETST
jgi:hypothetical protein